MKQAEDEPVSVPEQESLGPWWRLRQRLGLAGSTSQQEASEAVATTEFEAVDPLGGILHPNWERRKAAKAAEANRFIARRILDRLVAWAKADEPNLTTGDTMLIVDAEEMRNPPPLTGQQQRDIQASVDAFADFEPDPTDFYDDLLRSPDSASNPQQDRQ